MKKELFIMSKIIYEEITEVQEKITQYKNQEKQLIQKQRTVECAPLQTAF